MPNKRDVDAWKKRVALLLRDESTMFDEQQKYAVGFVMELFDLYCENVPMKSDALASDSPKA